MLLLGPEQRVAYVPSQHHSQVQVKRFPNGLIWKLLELPATSFLISVALPSY